MGLRVRIYKSAGQSFSNGGVSSRCDEVTLVNVDGPFEPSEQAPAALLLPGNLAGTLKVVPEDEPGEMAGPMMGGCFVNTSDSRFSEACERILGTRFYGAVALHDRWETWAFYNSMD